MKKLNSISDFDKERRSFLLRNFREALAVQSEIDKTKAFHTVASAPAPRFWVSETRAADVVGKLLKGKEGVLDKMYPEKQRMYKEIFRRFMEMRQTEPNASIAELIFRIVNDEAPDSYLTVPTVRTIIYREQQRLRKERRELLNGKR